MSDDVKQREIQALQAYDLPNGWVWTTIGEAAETTSGGTPSRQHPEYYEGNIPWVKSGELKDGRIVDVQEHITQEALDNSSAKVFPKDTPLVALYGATIGQTGILGLDAATNQAICAIFPRKNAFISEFVTYWLRYQRPQLVDSGAGGAQPNISQRIIRAFPLPLPPLPEQYRIVDAIETQFTRLDAAVATLERAQANLSRYRASVLQAAVEGRLVPTEADLAREESRDYEPADALLARILEERRARWEAERWQTEIERAKKKAAQAERKAAGLPYYIRQLPEESWIDRTEEEYAPYLPKSDRWKQKYDEPEPPDTEDLPELPRGWVWSTVEQLAEVQTGATPLRSNKAYYEDGTIPWVKSGAVNQPFIDKAEEYITTLALEETSVKLLPKGSLLVAMYGEGRTRGKVSELSIEATTNQACAGLIFNDFANRCKPFVKVFFQENYDMIRRESSGGVQPNLNLTKIRETVLPLPPLAEQRRIVKEVERRLSVVDALEEAVEANLTRAERLRQAILKTAFEGRLVDQNPDDEPASALLARIQAGRA